LRNPRWLRAYNAGARPERLLWPAPAARPKASGFSKIKALASFFTVNTMPEDLEGGLPITNLGPMMAQAAANAEAVAG